MRSTTRGTLYIITFGLVLLIFIGYRYGFKDRYFNLMSSTTTIDLRSSDKAILIEKHPEQQSISKLELTIRGKLSDNITLYLSEDAKNTAISIRIKAGKVNTAYVSNWNKDVAYLLIDNPNQSNSQLEVEYQFVSGK